MRRITMLLQDESIQKENVTGNNILVKTIAEKMYFPEGDHMKRRIRSGNPLDAHSVNEGRTFMRTIIILWGINPSPH
jgi:hypothetical protein